MSFFRKFGVPCFLETPLLRFTLLPYYRRNIVLSIPELLVTSIFSYLFTCSRCILIQLQLSYGQIFLLIRGKKLLEGSTSSDMSVNVAILLECSTYLRPCAYQTEHGIWILYETEHKYTIVSKYIYSYVYEYIYIYILYIIYYKYI